MISPERITEIEGLLEKVGAKCPCDGCWAGGERCDSDEDLIAALIDSAPDLLAAARFEIDGLDDIARLMAERNAHREDAARLAASEARAERWKGLAKDGMETWEPLLADADLDAGSNPCWLSVHQIKSALAADSAETEGK